MKSWKHLEHQKATRRAPRSSQEAPKKLPRSLQEAPKRLLGGALGVLGGPKGSPSHDPRYIHRFQSLQESSRRSPSHDLSALSAFSSLHKGDECVRVSVEPGLSRARPDPRTRSRTRFLRSLFVCQRSKRRCSLLTGGSADDGKRFSSDGRCIPIASRREDLKEGTGLGL